MRIYGEIFKGFTSHGNAISHGDAIEYETGRFKDSFIMDRRHQLCQFIADISLQLGRGCSLQEILQCCTQSLVENLDAALA